MAEGRLLQVILRPEIRTTLATNENGKAKGFKVAATEMYETRLFGIELEQRGLPSLKAVLKGLEAPCREILEKYVTDDWPRQFQVLRDAKTFSDYRVYKCWGLMHDDTTILARDGGPQVYEVLYSLKHIKQLIGYLGYEPSGKAAIESAIELGRVIERLGVRHAEPDMASGKKSRLPREEHRRKQAAKVAEKAEEFEKAYHCERTGNVSHTTAIERAAEELEISVRTGWDYAKARNLKADARKK
jgi:hypothetical protein